MGPGTKGNGAFLRLWDWARDQGAGRASATPTPHCVFWADAVGHLAGRCNPRGLQGLFGRGWADLAGYSRGGGGAVGVVGGGPPPCRNFVLAPKESTYACSTTGPGRGLGLLPRAGAGLWGVLCSAEAGQLAFPQTALHHPSVELYRGGPCTGLPLDPAPQPASVLRAPRLRSHLGMRPWRCFGRGVKKKKTKPS